MKLKTPGTRGWILALVTGLIAFALPYLLRVENYGSTLERVPGWWMWFGGVGCAVIIVVSKWLGRMFLSKPEDWYD